MAFEISGSEVPKEAKESIKKPAPEIHQIYLRLRAEESQSPDSTEVISTASIHETDPEYARLISAGVTPDQISTKRISRAQLLQAGYVFNNYPLSFMEKPLLNSVVGDTDFGQRKLLTAEELQTVLQFQRQNPLRYGSSDISTDNFREAYLSALLSAKNPIPRWMEAKVVLFRHCLHSIDQSYSTDPRQVEIDSLYKQLAQLQWDNEYESSQVTGTSFSDIQLNFMETKAKLAAPWDEPDRSASFPLLNRHHAMRMYDTRFAKLDYLPSPFLDSGFLFLPQIDVGDQIVGLGNPDLTVISSDRKRLFRLNMLSFHLLSRGLSEMGDNSSGNGEQDYSVGHYLSELAPKSSTESGQLLEQEQRKFNLIYDFDSEQLISGVITEIKAYAVEWASTDTAPDQAKTLLQQIQVLESNHRYTSS